MYQLHKLREQGLSVKVYEAGTGVGATGVQVRQEVAKTADTLAVFQLAPEWCAP